ncbi:hypothetical protein [Pseudomonas lini]
MATFNQATLEQLKAQAVTKYKDSTHGYDTNAETCPKTLRPIGKMVVGAEVFTVVAYQTQIIPTYIEYAAKGYTYSPTGTIPLSNAGSAQIYFLKPEKPADLNGAEVRVHGVQYQCDDIKQILAEVESKYRADCAEADKAATLAEEQRILAEVTALVDAQIESERQARIEVAKAERQAMIDAATKPTKKAAK